MRLKVWDFRADHAGEKAGDVGGVGNGEGEGADRNFVEEVGSGLKGDHTEDEESKEDENATRDRVVFPRRDFLPNPNVAGKACDDAGVAKKVRAACEVLTCVANHRKNDRENQIPRNLEVVLGEFPEEPKPEHVEKDVQEAGV